VQELILEDQARLGVERAERLVHEDDLGIIAQRADDVAALAHPPRQLVRVMVLEAAEPYALDQLGGSTPPLSLRDPAHLQGKLHVLAQRPPGIEVVGLGDVADLGVHALDGRALVEHLTRRGRQETGDHVEQGRLAAAARSHDGEELAGRDVEVDVGDGVDDAPARVEVARDPAQREDVVHGLPILRDVYRRRIETLAGLESGRVQSSAMDDETRSGFDEMRQGFAEMRQRFVEIDRRFDAVDRRFDAVDRRFEAVEERLGGEIRRVGVVTEDLRTQIQLVAEGVEANERAIERVRVEMNERFRENEIVVGAAFRQIRRDIDELRDRR